MQCLAAETLQRQAQFRCAFSGRTWPPLVERITDHGVTQMSHVHPNLVGTPRLQRHPQQCVVAIPAANAVMGHRPAATSHHGELLAVPRVAAKGLVDSAAGDDVALDDSQIVAPHLAPRQLSAQLKMGPFRARDDEAAGGFLVETMDDAKTRHPPQFRIPIKQGVLQRAVPVSGAGVDEHPGGLVQHQKVAILDQNIERQVLGRMILRRRLEIFQHQRHLLLSAQPVALRRRVTIDTHAPATNEFLQPRPRVVG